jgi:hypothetical protein
MSEIVNGSSGTDQKASGTDGEVVSDSSETSKDQVAYDTYRKVLSEKKKRDEELKLATEELSKMRKLEKERVEHELKAKEDYKKLLELRENELKEKDEKLKSIETNIQESAKFSALLDALPGQLPKKYWQMIDTSGIVIDPTTGTPDPTSVKKIAESFQNSYGELLVKPGQAKMPNAAASGSTSVMTEELWKSLSGKEKKERLPEYVESLKQKRGI